MKLLGYTVSDYIKIAKVREYKEPGSKRCSVYDLRKWYSSNFSLEPDSMIEFSLSYISIDDKYDPSDWVARECEILLGRRNGWSE